MLKAKNITGDRKFNYSINVVKKFWFSYTVTYFQYDILLHSLILIRFFKLVFKKRNT